MSQLFCEAFNELDGEIKQEFYEDVQAAIKDINECALILETGADNEVINRLFRSLHTVKGNCNMVFLHAFVDASHKLEDLFSDIRSGEIEYHNSYGKFAVIVANIIEKQLVSMIENHYADGEKLQQLELIVETIQKAESDNRLLVTEKAIIAIQDGHFNLNLVAIDQEQGTAFSFLDATDLEFFQFISDKQNVVDSQHHDFMLICQTLALKLNALLGHSVEVQQIQAALVFLGLSNRISPANELTINQVFFASGLLSRMSGWTTAAQLVLQALENHDGSGFPRGLRDDDILPAAQVIGLAIDFTNIVIQHQASGYKQSLFTAVKMINAQKDRRFKSRLIERFNAIIKTEYLTSQMW